MRNLASQASVSTSSALWVDSGAKVYWETINGATFNRKTVTGWQGEGSRERVMSLNSKRLSAMMSGHYAVTLRACAASADAVTVSSVAADCGGVRRRC